MVARVFSGIGQEVAHHLGYRLVVDDSSEVRVGHFNLERDAVLCEGWFKTFCHGVQHVAYILYPEPHHHTAVLHLTEVEQLVH